LQSATECSRVTGRQVVPFREPHDLRCSLGPTWYLRVKKRATRLLHAVLARVDRPPRYERDLGFVRRQPGKTLIIGIGVARSGKRWLSEIFDRHDNAASLAEPHRLLESFFFYCNWNGLPVDHAGFFHILNADINHLFERHDVVYVASPWLSLGLAQVEDFLRPDAYFFSIRRPEGVVKSMVNKGWFGEDVIRRENSHATGPQPFLRDAHHHFSRVTPVGSQYAAWQQLAPVGRCAWYWNELNQRIERELASVPANRIFRLRLEDIDQNFLFYRNVAAHFNLRPELTSQQFEAIKGQMPKIPRKGSRPWSELEQDEFEQHVATFSRRYEESKTSFL